MDQLGRYEIEKFALSPVSTTSFNLPGPRFLTPLERLDLSKILKFIGSLFPQKERPPTLNSERRPLLAR